MKKHSIKPDTVDYLSHPGVAAKLEKLWAAHSAAETDQDSGPATVKTKPRHIGPRTEVEKRKFYRRKRSKPMQNGGVETSTLAETAQQLEYDSEKSILRLIEAGKLAAKKKVFFGKKRWMVNRSEINRYKLIKDSKRLVERVPTPDGKQGQWRTSLKCYLSPGQPMDDRLPQFTLPVSIAEFWRFACKKLETEAGYEAIRSEIREKLPGKPIDFAIRFEFDQKQVDKDLQRIIEKVAPPRIPGEDSSTGQVISIRYDALIHLKTKALPSLWRAEHGWEQYLVKSVKNFYIDECRRSKPKDILLDDLADRDVLSASDFKAWREKDSESGFRSPTNSEHSGRKPSAKHSAPKNA